MKIATWNLARVQTKYKIPAIIEKIKEINADIWILTETSAAIDINGSFFGVQSIQLPTETLFDTVYYKKGENRTTIWSKYPVLENISTSNNYTNTCAKLETPLGNLIVYGTIIGIIGFRKPFFREDLSNTINDGDAFAQKHNFCLAGDFNTSFCDNFFFDGIARQGLNEFFKRNNLVNLTEKISNNIDHIVISKSFMKNCEIEIETWNHSEELSDHKGVAVTLKKL